MADDGASYTAVILISALTSAVVSVATVLAFQRSGLGTQPPPAAQAEPSYVLVPEVTGLAADTARELLAGRQLRLVIRERRADAERAADAIIEQSPLAGSRVQVEGEVSVVLSSGAPPATVPEVVGIPLEQAKAMLKGAGLVAGETRTTKEGEAGKVVAADPAPGAAVSTGQAVVLTVADPRIAVPDVRGKHVRTAREAIQEAGLKVGTVRERYFNRGNAYHVLEQTPEPDELVEPGTKVNLVINEGDY